MTKMELLAKLAELHTQAHQAEDAAHLRAGEWRRRRIRIEGAVKATIGDENEAREFLDILKQQSGCLTFGAFMNDPEILKEQEAGYRQAKEFASARSVKKAGLPNGG